MKILTFIIINFFSINLFATDTISYNCKYRYIQQKDSSKINSKLDDVMILSISKNKSIYYSYLRHYGNKLMEEDMSNMNANVSNINLNSNSVGKYFINNEAEIIEIDYEKKKIHITDQLISSYYGYKDTLEVCKWKITNDTLTILNQKCQKATTTFKGRSYLAWFAPDIPIHMGPWLFNGVPGLILAVSDTKNQFYF